MTQILNVFEFQNQNFGASQTKSSKINIIASVTHVITSDHDVQGLMFFNGQQSFPLTSQFVFAFPGNIKLFLSA